MSMEIEVTSKSDDGVAELKDQANTDDPLLSGLSRTEIKKNRVAAAFWKYVWPKLEESGWVKVSSSILVFLASIMSHVIFLQLTN